MAQTHNKPKLKYCCYYDQQMPNYYNKFVHITTVSFLYNIYSYMFRHLYGIIRESKHVVVYII